MHRFGRIITLNPHPAIDRLIEAPGLVPGAHIRGRVLGRQPAGKGLNVSRALAALGRASRAMGFVGDRDAAWFAESIRSTGGRIDCLFTPVAGPTRENLTLVEPASRGNRETHIRLTGLSVCPADITRLRRALAGGLRPDDILIIAGSRPPGMTPADVVHLITTAHRAGARVALDIDPQALAAVLHAGRPVWLIKPNEEEARAALGRGFASASPAQLAAALAGHAEWAAVSLGAKGAILATADQQWTGRIPATALPRPARSTVGCGDCFLAGMVDAILAGAAPAEVLRRALAVGAANALVLGAANFRATDVRFAQRKAVVSALRASKKNRGI